MSVRFTYRKQYDDAADKVERELTDIDTGIDTPVQQQFKDDVNINVMMKRFGVTDGAFPPAAADPRYYGDFSDAVDFREALDRTRAAIDNFNELPADIRQRFYNDPVELWNFVSNEKNHEEAVQLGLLHKSSPPATVPTVPDTQP